MQLIDKMNKKHPNCGPILYISSIQYFIVQLLVGLKFSPNYNLAKNTISDLGNTKCGIYDLRSVCSPEHTLMNISFIILGITLLAGTTLIYRQLEHTKYTHIGFILFTLSGVGVILVGLFPENTITFLHGFGATLSFLCGNIGFIMLGLHLNISEKFKHISVAFGLIALGAFGLFLINENITLGEGTMERIAAYPQTIWMISVGIYFYIKNRSKLIK
jgi:hypothetical membrane protein